MTTVPYRELLSGDARYKPLTKGITSHAGRNHRGVITTRHKGGGVKKLYRIVDFKQSKMNVPGRVATIEKDPYRNAFISRIIFADGEQSYILAVKGLAVGDTIITQEKAPLKNGNRMMLKHIPVGTFVSNIEMNPGSGGKIARAAGAYAEVLAHEGKFTNLKIGSKEVRRIVSTALATIGQISNPDYNLTTFGKAGKSRWKGIRPTVRGSAMNPVDHPYGGGEGRQPRGTKRPKTKWGKVTGGRKTRKSKKWSTKLIVSRRTSKRK